MCMKSQIIFIFLSYTQQLYCPSLLLEHISNTAHLTLQQTTDRLMG